MKTVAKKKPGRPRGKSTITLFRLAMEKLRDQPIGSTTAVDGFKFRRTADGVEMFG